MTRFRGAVVTQECVEKLIRKDMVDPVTEDKLGDGDIIPLQRVRLSLCHEMFLTVLDVLPQTQNTSRTWSSVFLKNCVQGVPSLGPLTVLSSDRVELGFQRLELSCEPKRPVQ